MPINEFFLFPRQGHDCMGSTKKPLLPDVPVQGHGCRDSYQTRYSGKSSHRLFNGRSDLAKPFFRKFDGHWVHKQPVHDRG